MKLNFIGDLIFGDQPVTFGVGVDSKHRNNKYIDVFKGVSSHLNDVDYTIGNFESIIKPRTFQDDVSSWTMCCDENISKVLKENNINIVSVANNHTMDYGLDWFNYTVENLKKNELQVIGLKEKPYVILEKDNKKTAIIGVSYLIVREKNLPYFYNPSDEEWVNLFNILKEERVDTIIVFPHWGNEFVEKINEKQLSILKQLAVYNIDLVIGHHSHIIQDEFKFNDSIIFPSLGNFVSDYWQNRLRKTFILNFDTSTLTLKKINCKINFDGVPISQNIEIISNIRVFDNKLVTKKDINSSRWKMRFEYLSFVVLNFFKLRGKKKILLWLLKRLKYVANNFIGEIKNPDVIYEKYKH